MKWTAEQEAVLTARGCNLLVAAAAGSGKTAVLVERIVRLVLEGETPPDLDNILVVTFTQAAAAEMRERIRKALTGLATAGNERARGQLARISDAPISTIHSFCLNVLREQFHQAGLEPGFRVGEQTECALMLAEAVDALMDECYGRDPLDPAVADLLDCHAGYRDDTRLRERITEMWRFSRTMPWPDAWLEASLARMRIPEGTDFGQTDWGRILLEQALWRLEDLARETERALRLAEDAGFDSYAATLLLDQALLEGLTADLDGGWDAAVRALQAVKFSSLKRAPKDADPLVRDRIKDARQKVKDGVSRIGEELLCGFSDAVCADIRGESGRLETLVALVQALDRVYGRMKRRRNLVDFDDMEHMTLGLLAVPDPNGTAVPTALAETMRARWHAVMIDEYQDSNLVQETILGAVATQGDQSGNLFMVGDVKQSIYRFRQAMPELFLSKYATYPLQAGTATRKILLHRNFRSRKPVLEAVNLAFARLMTPQLGEMEYTEAESLLAGAEFPDWNGMEGAPVSFHLIDAASHIVAEEGGDAPSDSAEGNGEDAPEGTEGEIREEADETATGDPALSAEELEAVQEEAAWAAATIRRLVRGDASDAPFQVASKDGILRPVRYSDCAVLLRATSGWAQVFVEEFALQNVPLFTDTGAGHFASVEVGVMLSLLEVLDNPLQDIPLAAVLRSPIGGWDETAIATVRQADAEGRLLDAMRRHDGPYAEACVRMLERLEGWRSLARAVPVGDLLERLYDETGYALHVAALPQGRRRMANLRLLAERAVRFETTGFRGLFQFLRYVERLRLAKGDMDGAKTLGESEDIVRLMSIHKSKGLEYPVVLLCGTGRQFNLRDRNSRLLLHHRYGFGPDGVLPDVGVIWPTAAKRALQAVSTREMLSEEMRILYVALTRAKERLFVCGRMADPAGRLQALADLPEAGALPAGALLPLKSHAQWLLAAWGPWLRQGNGPFELVVHTRADILAMRTGTVSESEMTVPEAAHADAVPYSVATRARVPDGQLSLFDEPEPDPVRARMENCLEEARRRLAWRPPFPKLSALPTKMTVTALKRLWEEQDDAAAKLEEAFRIACTLPEEVAALAVVEPETDDSPLSLPSETDDALLSLPSEPDVVLPRFVLTGRDGSGQTTGLRYGTLMHLVIQHLDPVEGRVPDIEVVIDGLCRRGLMAEEERTVPNRRALEAFVHSDLFARMARAGEIHRETPFTVRMPASDILRDPSVPATETVVMQGIVDCWFLEAGRIVIVDYKTDRGMARVPAYRRQLRWYAAALEKTTGLPVGETVLWFLHHGRAIGEA